MHVSSTESLSRGIRFCTLEGFRRSSLGTRWFRDTDDMEQAPDLAHELLETLRGISRRLEEQSKRLSKEHGLTLPQLMCLEAIGAAEEPPTLATLADLVKLSSATVSRIVERLVRAGLVDRSRGIVDRRHVRLTLTSAGQERYEAPPAPLCLA